MSEFGAASPERAIHRTPRIVIDGNTLGTEIIATGAGFNLHDLFFPDPQLGADKFTNVFFRTHSGNIYLLTRTGELLSANECRRRGALVAAALDRERLAGGRLTVGRPFDYGGGETTRVTEIVPITSRVFATGQQAKDSEYRYNPIAKEFVDALPPPGALSREVYAESTDPLGALLQRIRRAV